MVDAVADVRCFALQVALNPFHTIDTLIQSQAFENKVRASAKKNL
jgi:hypothetical protein